MDLVINYDSALKLDLREKLHNTNIFTREQDFTHVQEYRDICLNKSILLSGTYMHKFNNMILNDSKDLNLKKSLEYKDKIKQSPLYHKLLNQFLHTVPSTLNKSINLALAVAKHDLKDCFNVSIKSKLYIKNHHTNQKDPLHSTDSLIHNLDITYHGLYLDLKSLCSKHINFVQGLSSNHFESLLTISESILKIHQAHTTDIQKPIKTIKDYKLRIDKECKELYPGKDITLMNKSDFNPFLVFEEFSKPISYFRKSNVLKILKSHNNVPLTIALSIAFYMVALRSMFKIQTPKSKFAVAYSPVQIIPALVVGSLHATSKIIEFANKNGIVDNKFELPNLDDYVLILKCYLQGDIKAIYCSQCGNIHFMFKDSINVDEIKDSFIFLCHSCETQERRASLVVDNMVKHTFNEYVQLFLSSKKKLSDSTINKNIQYFNCYNKNYMATLEHFISKKRTKH